MKMINKTVLLLSVMLLSACAGTYHFTPVVPAANESVVYLYRPKADNPGRQPLRLHYPEVFVDGKTVGPLQFNKRKKIHLTPGKHQLKLTGLSEGANWDFKDKLLDFEVVAGEVKYIKFNVRFNLNEMHILDPGADYLIHLTPMNSGQAVYEVRYTKDE